MAIRQQNQVEDTAVNTAAVEDKAVVDKAAEAAAAETKAQDKVKAESETKAEVVEKADAEPETKPEVEKETAAGTAAETATAEPEHASASVLEEEEEEAPTPTPTKEVAAAPEQTTAVAKPVHQSGLMAQITADLAEQGFEGVELDYSSFLNITLNKTIETSEGQEMQNSGFLVRLASSRLKFCFRNNNPVEDEVEVAYSYDRNADKDPESPVFAAIAKWREEGLELADVKTYTEVLAIMLDDKLEGEEAGELNGKLITIQVAPTSKGRWAGYTAQLSLQGVKEISSVKTLIRRGKKVESGKFPFYPWDFVNKGPIAATAE